MKNNLLWVVLLGGAAIWIFDLQRRLQAARMRGDMYRDISARLDRQMTALSAAPQEPPTRPDD